MGLDKQESMAEGPGGAMLQCWGLSCFEKERIMLPLVSMLTSAARAE